MAHATCLWKLLRDAYKHVFKMSLNEIDIARNVSLFNLQVSLVLGAYPSSGPES